MESVADFYNKPRRVVFTYEGHDDFIPPRSAGTTRGVPFNSGFGHVVIYVDFDLGKSYEIALADLEFEIPNYTIN